jgi:hypothetical protein
MTRMLHALPVLLYLAAYSTKTLRSCAIIHDQDWAKVAPIVRLPASAARATMACLTDRSPVPTLPAIPVCIAQSGYYKGEGSAA